VGHLHPASELLCFRHIQRSQFVAPLSRGTQLDGRGRDFELGCGEHEVDTGSNGLRTKARFDHRKLQTILARQLFSGGGIRRLRCFVVEDL